MECLMKAPIWPNAFDATRVAKTATEALILAALTVDRNLGILRQSKLVFLMDLAPTGIIPMQKGNASLAILIAKHVNSHQHNARNANPSISNKDSVVLISAYEVFMETMRHNLVNLTLLSQVCSR